MSFGGTGGRTKMTSKVTLNLYDLSPANEYLYALGLGLHHSGIEILGTEYSFASGAGIFEAPPKSAGGAIYRESIELGYIHGGSTEVKRVLDELKQEFAPDKYNLIKKNSIIKLKCQDHGIIIGRNFIILKNILVIFLH